MDMSGEVSISASRARVWAALNDPAVLARCIDGVESLARVIGDDGAERLEGRMNARVGPVRATFAGQVTLVDVVAPESYRLVGEGKGGVAGFAKGEARVTLAENGTETTQLSYQVSSSVGGKLAQLGARLIEGAAKAYATTFFERLRAEVEGSGDVNEAPEIVNGSPPSPAPATPNARTAAPPPPTDNASSSASGNASGGGLPPLVWGGAVIVAVLAFLAWQWL